MSGGETLGSDSPEIYLQQAVQKALRRQFAEAIQDYDKAIGLDPGAPAAYYNRGKSKSALGMRAEAVKDFISARDFAKRTNNQKLRPWLNGNWTSIMIRASAPVSPNIA